jgi:hypothetical protein
MRYKVYCSTQNNPAGTHNIQVDRGTSVNLKDLAANTVYYVWVSATDGRQESGLSPALNIKTAAPPDAPPPAAPVTMPLFRLGRRRRCFRRRFGPKRSNSGPDLTAARMTGMTD